MLAPASATEEAYELHRGGDDASLLLVCEHASLRLPSPWSWPEEDRWLLGTHWSFDLGAADLSRGLAREIGCAAVLSRFTRLLIDPNRDLAAPTLFRVEAEGHPIHLNAAISPADRERRITDYYTPYHDQIDHRLRAAPAAALLSVHTFTPVYDGHVRAVEIGVLFDEHADLAQVFARELRRCGWRSALNEPYSGQAGFAFSPQHHAANHQRPWLEIEIRQDIAVDLDRRPALIAALTAAIRRTFASAA
ncbi:MAG: N-formylglutamate amidohydrolase [Nannocystis sp.]|nr:N-formylglutamate amidohydrolase [Nannocystis sp.]